ncbi:MAG: sensor histidine kinase [Actinomycetota bacterium]|nr:sensor histidine kinase [Actinomycetota bacterium]
MRPLDPLSSIKVKLAVVIVAAVAVTMVVNEVGLRLHVQPAARAAVAGALGLAMVQLLAHGMTSPLRAMAEAARAMAAGDHGRQVRATSRDEVGELARAFNAMAAELAEVDRVRKDLVANVSHELRTPITALQAVLEGDPERVHQVVANLVENAVRCSPAGGTVELSASTDHRAVTIAVSDQGPGIAPADAERVFERFYRADPARSSTSGGAGLGLAIARWIVDLHGGQIRPEPVEPHGCRMVVVLPRGATT